jgi:hypothetical protein
MVGELVVNGHGNGEVVHLWGCRGQGIKVFL